MGNPSAPLQGSAQQTTLAGSVNQDFTPTDPSDPTQFCPGPFTLEVGTSDIPPLEGRVTDGAPPPLQGRVDDTPLTPETPSPGTPVPEKPPLTGGTSIPGPPPLKPEIPVPELPKAPTLPAQAKWDVPCVLKILCAIDPAVVADLANTTVVAVDSVTWDDYIFDGTQWVQDRPNGLGGWNGSVLVIISGENCQAAVQTLYHELIHKHQPAEISWSDSELFAYSQTEQWLIAHGLPGEYHRPGDSVPNIKLIERQVKSYPTRRGPTEVEADRVHNRTKWYDPATGRTYWLPSRRGDHVAGDEIRSGERAIPRSQWRCP